MANNLIVASPSGKSEGAWDSIHVFEAVDRARTAHYKLTSTVILHLSTGNDNLGDMDLSGNMTRQVCSLLDYTKTLELFADATSQIESDLPVENDSSHIVNIGKVILPT